MRTRSTFLTLLAVAAMAVLGGAPALAQVGTYRMEFGAAHGSGTTETENPTYSSSKSAGAATVSATFQSDKIAQIASGQFGPTAHLSPGLRASGAATASWKAPAGSDPKKDESFDVTLSVTLTDDRATVLCSASEKRTVPENQTTSISIDIGSKCSAITDLAVTGRAAGINVEVALTAPVGDHVTDGFGFNYDIWANWDEIHLANLVPFPPGPFASGSQQTFTGLVTAALGTRKNAEIRVLLVDADFKPLAASDAIPRARVSAHECCPKSFSLGPVKLPAERTGIYLFAVLTDPSMGGEILATAYQPYSVVLGSLAGVIRRHLDGETDYWLPGVPVELWEFPAGAAPVATTLSKLRGTVEFPSSVYEFTDLPPGFDPTNKIYQLKARFQDGLEPHYIDTSDLLRAEWQTFQMRPGFNVKDLNVVRGELSGTLAPDEREELEVGAELYWHLWRQAYVMTPAFLPPGVGLTRHLPVRTHCCVGGVFGYTPKTGEIAVPRAALGASPHLVWRAWGSHVLHELWGSDSVPVESDEAGDDVLKQVISEFQFSALWAAESARVIEGARDGVVTVPAGIVSLEANSGQPFSVMWDLIDSHIDIEPRTVGDKSILAADAIDELDLQDLTTAIAVAPHPENVDALLSRLVDLYGPRVAGIYRDGLTLVQHLVELHRVPKKVITRRPVPLAGAATDPFAPIAGSFIDVKLVTPGGSDLAASRLDIDFVFGPGYETQNRKESRLVSAGNVYFQMPDEHYPVQAFLSIPGSTEAPLMIDNAAYWAAVPTTADHFLSHTFVVPQDVPQVDSTYPTFAAAGARVQVLGRNFASDPAASTVTFGTQAARVLSATPTLLLVEVPALPRGKVPVTVTRAGKTSAAVDFDVLAPALSVSAASLAFGAVAQGTTAKKTVTVKNDGLAPLVISAASTTGAFTAAPAATPSAPITVDPGADVSFQVSFTPLSAAAEAGTLVIATNDVAHRTATVALSGSGGTATGADIAASPGVIDFGSVALTQSRETTLVVRNRGGAPLTVSAATFGATQFTLVSPALPVTLASGAEQAFVLKFAPTALGFVARSMTLASNDPGEPTLAIPLSGIGVASGTTPPACSYGIGPTTIVFPRGASSATVTVTAPAGCAWSATSSASFATLGAAAGSGNGSVTVQVSPNDTLRERMAQLTIAGLAVAVSQETEGAATTTVPIVLSTQGVGTAFFTSELTLTNRGNVSAVAEFTYTAAFGGGTGTASDIVPAGAQLIFPDALEYLRSLGIPIPATGNRGGTLRVKFIGVASASAGSATVRTASVVPEGRAGLAYGSVARGAALTGTSYLCGLRQNATDRANVAVINAGKADEGDVVLRLTVLSGDPAAPTSKVLPDVALAPGGFAQFSGILGANGLSLTNGWVKVEKVAGKSPYFAYAIINDQKNSDGSFVPPVTAESLAGRTGETLPVIVEVATFSTELVVTNFGTARKSFQVTFVADGVTAANNATSVTFDLAAGEQRILPDFVQYLRDHHATGVGPKGPTFAGAAFLSVSSGDVSGLFIGARTSSPGGGGRYGLFYTGVPSGAAATTSPVYLYGLQQNADNRANVAFVNTGETDGSTDTLKVEIYDGATGSLVRIFELTLGPRRWNQVSGILTQYAPGVSNAYVKVTRTAGKNPFVAYAVVNDGGAPGLRSGDGAFVTMDTSE